MYLTPVETLCMILAIAAGTMLTRFLPFMLFPAGKERPPIIEYLGKRLPPAMLGLLVIYCLKGVSITVAPYGLPEGASIALVIILHLWKRNFLLSIAAGTALYMLLVQGVLR